MRFLVTLRAAHGSRTLNVAADDEWEARRRAIQRNVAMGGPPMWVSRVWSA